jgi:two-component system, NtrC family, sensor kinase
MTDAARVEALEAELRQLREEQVADRAGLSVLRESNARLERVHAALAAELRQRDRELGESREQQAATADVLRAIATSPIALEPVLEAVVESAGRLCPCEGVSIWRVHGDEIVNVVATGSESATVPRGSRLPLDRHSVNGRAVFDGRTIHVHDVLATPDARAPRAMFAAIGPGRTMLAVPLRHRDNSVGSLTVVRHEVRPFTADEIRLLEAFADQATIAIANTSLFQALDDRNRELAEALEQQTATSEILRVIASSPSDLQPVLDALVTSVMRLCGASGAGIFRADDDEHYVAATCGTVEIEPIGERRPLDRASVNGRAILERRTIHVGSSRSWSSATSS